MKRAYVTMVNDPRYIEGVKVLSHSLAATGTDAPLIILVSDLSDFEMAELEGLPAAIRSVDHIEVATSVSRNFPMRSKTFSKINAWLLEEYDRCVFIDADILVLNRLDYLFEYSEFAAAGTAEYFNTGVFVFEPSRGTYELLREAIETIATDDSYADDSEQELLQRVFRSGFQELPYRSNFRPYHGRGLSRHGLQRWKASRWLVRRLRPEWSPDTIHYIGYPKPWEVYLPEQARDESQYTWTARQLRSVRWAFEMWRDAWRSMTTTDPSASTAGVAEKTHG